jgi:hypothetical protein
MCMKTIALMIVCGVIFTINLAGQNDKNRNPFNNQKNDSLRIAPYFDDHTYSKLYKKFDLPDNITISPGWDLEKKHFNIESSTIKPSNDKLLAEKFPGSDRFYAKRGYVYNPADKSFIIIPDTTVKYYLIIKFPLNLRMYK